ncbi:MAG: 2-oxo acid dehydrogenase subunit E2 [Bacteroidales bacterium]|nr:2-oxo acid dehydrogenase subunit E2 [Bacteroidales bacterium]
MATPVIMPKQGQSVESCILTTWNKKKGDPVKKGDVLFSYETDKASFEAEAEADGIILETFYAEGDEIPVLVNIAVIGQPGESVDEFRPGKELSPVRTDAEKEENKIQAPPDEVKTDVPDANLPTEDGAIKISPRARMLAVEKGVPLATIKGSGPGGRILERDIHQYLLHYPRMTPLAGSVADREGLSSKGKGTGLSGAVTADDLGAPAGKDLAGYIDKPLTNIRKIIARAMHASLQQSAQLTHHMGADVSRLLEIRKKVKTLQEKGYPYNITLNDMICYAVIRALQKHPAANAHFLGESIRYFSSVHLGLAVDTDRGLMVPALLNASELSLIALSQELKTMAEQCRNGSINPDLLAPASASFTVSNLGNYGVEMFTPVINLPQVAILGVNTITYRPRPFKEYSVEFMPSIGLSLTYDHRAIDGGPATIFLAEIKNEIENFEWNPSSESSDE